jgi:hypothetical protein
MILTDGSHTKNKVPLQSSPFLHNLFSGGAREESSHHSSHHDQEKCPSSGARTQTSKHGAQACHHPRTFFGS